MALPLTYGSLTVADNTVKANGEPETSTWSVAVTTATPANVADLETAFGTLMTAIQAVSLGNNQKKEIVYARTILGATPAASTAAQRENKWLCRYHDNTTFKKFVVSLPCADLTKLVSGSEFLVLTGGAGATLKTAFEAVVVSPDDASHSVTLDSVQFVGRNS